jgi:6-phospho-3-hexuloisomerase
MEGMDPRKVSDQTFIRRNEKAFYQALKAFGSHIYSLYDKIDVMQVMEFATNLHRINNRGGYTYIYGLGRSGLVGRAFLERLSNLEYSTFLIGEPGTPAIREGDAVVLISGSGRTSLVVHVGEISKQRGGKNFGVTSKPDSSLAECCDYILEVPGKTRIDTKKNYLANQITGYHAPLAPLGSLFEVGAFIVLDSIIAELAELKGFEEEDIRKRHFDY